MGVERSDKVAFSAINNMDWAELIRTYCRSCPGILVGVDRPWMIDHVEVCLAINATFHFSFGAMN